MTSPYCEMVFTGQNFNNKPIYECQYCHIKLGLEDPDTKILCFKKMQEYTVSLKKIHNSDYSDPIHLDKESKVEDFVFDYVQKKYSQELKPEPSDQPENMCSKEEVQKRLQICGGCEYYKDDSCVLCGCVVVREINHMNKLAHKDQKCPIDKWGPIIDTNIQT